jgi:tartronate-semialdehyde synthase
MAAAGKGIGGGVVDSGEVRLKPANQGRGFDFVKFAEACGTMGERVTEPNELKAALERGVESGMPYIVEVILERETDCSMGMSIDAIKEFE